jgi:hypothetical protein
MKAISSAKAVSVVVMVMESESFSSKDLSDEAVHIRVGATPPKT